MSLNQFMVAVEEAEASPPYGRMLAERDTKIEQLEQRVAVLSEALRELRRENKSAVQWELARRQADAALAGEQVSNPYRDALVRLLNAMHKANRAFLQTDPETKAAAMAEHKDAIDAARALVEGEQK